MNLCYKPFQNLFPLFESANGIVPILNGIWICKKKSSTVGFNAEPHIRPDFAERRTWPLRGSETTNTRGGACEGMVLALRAQCERQGEQGPHALALGVI